MSNFDLPLQPNLLCRRRIVEPSIVNNHVICIHGMYTRWSCFHDIFCRESQISERVYPIRDRRDSAEFLNEFRHRDLFTRKIYIGHRRESIICIRTTTSLNFYFRFRERERHAYLAYYRSPTQPPSRSHGATKRSHDTTVVRHVSTLPAQARDARDIYRWRN